MSRHRNYIARRNRSRQHQKESALWNSNGVYLGKPWDQVSRKLSLEAWAEDGRTFMARYGYRRCSGWKLIRSDPELDFLRFCGLKDCSAALKNRHLSFRWLGVQPQSTSPEAVGGAL